jgi:hypothetical protein
MTDHAELPPRSFFNADDLSLLIAEHPDAPQFLAVKIADAHDAAIAALVAERDALREALKPFADYAVEQFAKWIPPNVASDDATPVWGSRFDQECSIYIGDLKRAAALAQGEKP